MSEKFGGGGALARSDHAPQDPARDFTATPASSKDFLPSKSVGENLLSNIARNLSSGLERLRE